MPRIVSGSEAVDQIKDNMTVLIGGFVGAGVAEEILAQLEERFLKTGHPNNLTIVACAGVGDKKTRGLNHFANDGMIRKVILGHMGQSPRLGQFIADEKAECLMLPQGTLTHILRASAAGKPGILTHVGLKTFVDPRVEGGRANKRTKADMVEVMEIAGRDYLFYKAIKADVAIIRATTADTQGNLSLEREAIFADQFTFAVLAHNSGGIVISQVERLAEAGSLHPHAVKVPGLLVDYVVLSKAENHLQTFLSDSYNPAYTGEVRAPLTVSNPLPMGNRKICARRAAKELYAGAIVNIGIGVAEGVSNVVAEAGLSDKLILTIESGTVGGLPAGGMGIGASTNPTAVLEQAQQFDFYDGGGIDVAFLGLAEVDRRGNLNVSKFAGKVVGPGGFINITQNAKKLVYCGTFTTDGLRTELHSGALHIIQEGKKKKFVREVEQITFSGDYAASIGQEVLYVTERAVFRLSQEGMTLLEVAPGISVEKDILAQMEFEPLVSPHLKMMDADIFNEAVMALNLV